MDAHDYKKHTAEYADAAHGTHHHSHFKLYMVIWGALLVGTLLTVVTGRMDLGSAGLAVALAIATTKAMLVVMYFMHMNEARGFTRLVMGITVLFIGVLLAYVLGDFAGRFRPANSMGSSWSDLPAGSVNQGLQPWAPGGAQAPQAPGQVGHSP
jgi:cytochrome c oxidase subunit 4